MKSAVTQKTNDKPKKVQPRHLSRIAAVQALYQMDMSGAEVEDVIEQFSAFRFAGPSQANDTGLNDGMLEGADPAFFNGLVEGVVERQREIDPLIDKQLAEGWRLVRVDSILRAILRAGAYELMARHDVPPGVIINEYINVGHAFFSDDEPRVINGVLHALAVRLRGGELKQKQPDPEADH